MTKLAIIEVEKKQYSARNGSYLNTLIIVQRDGQFDRCLVTLSEPAGPQLANRKTSHQRPGEPDILQRP